MVYQKPMEIGLLIDAGRCDWKDVEPAIFGTLLERALDPRERHKLGGHFTPRAYVERLVVPTIIEPVRDDWEAARAVAIAEVVLDVVLWIGWLQWHLRDYEGRGAPPVWPHHHELDHADVQSEGHCEACRCLW